MKSPECRLLLNNVESYDKITLSLVREKSYMKPELNSIKSVYENAHTPFLLCGKSLDIIWANAAAYEVFPAFKTPSGLKLYLPEQTLSEIKGITTAAQIKLWDININLLVQKMEDEFSLTFIPNEKEMLSESVETNLLF